MDIGESLIRTAAANGNITVSSHAYQRMKERCISIEQVYECIAKGLILERQDRERDLKLVFQENVVGDAEPTFYVVVACRILPVVVSVILFQEEKWEFKNGRMWRR